MEEKQLRSIDELIKYEFAAKRPDKIQNVSKEFFIVIHNRFIKLF